ncbi:excinuclease ABC subunit UvrA [Halobacillus litoralis]|uniref:excinuclease ABC subunit UvrA n=1 Tax=Halobacillus litoralis TaxID=45668 RepID=UPI00248FA60C|nr:excinuclease ABC subunit UvrA [Halobacillus litoralis]
MNHSIVIQGAKEHNLQNISLSIPKNLLVVLTGPSGSGKSSLAIDTLFKECQRQYLESMGMQGIEKPKVDSIKGLSPAISITQHVTNQNPRSTVGTVTDMYTSLRMIYEKLGTRLCPACQTEIEPVFREEDIEREENSFKEFIYCPSCKHRMEKLTRTHFSYNTTEGACGTCKGLGEVVNIDQSTVFHQERSLEEGAVDLWKGRYADYQIPVVKTAMARYNVPIDDRLPLQDYTEGQRAILYYGVESDEVKALFPEIKTPKTVGDGKFEGVLTGMWRRFSEKSGASAEAKAYFYSETCPDCHGERLNEESRHVSVAGVKIPELANHSLEEMLRWAEEVKSSIDDENYQFVDIFMEDLKTKLTRIIKTGLGYLTLDRQSITLSGGEAQRLRLSALLDSALTGVLYVMDEPTLGLHPKDVAGLVYVLKELRDVGNTVLVIEHDVDVMKQADYIIDMGPGAGSFGGEVVGEGTLEELKGIEGSLTGEYLRAGEKQKESYRKGTGQEIVVHQATLHNLKNVTVSFPIGSLISVTGVSGSGKSSLVFGALAKGNDNIRSGCEQVTGLEHFDQIVTVDQSPLSRMKRSNVATYTDLFTAIRNVFAKTPAAIEQNLTAKQFSFNTAGGRCENCEGMGYVATNMLFFPDLQVTCPVCHGRRFKQEVLSVTYNDQSIHDVLEHSIQESVELFKDKKEIKRILELLMEVGLGYLKLGQSLTTLSGGEGQRLKLAKELFKKTNKTTLYLLDEPTTGLHPSDVQQLMNLLNRLVEAGNTVITVEHDTQLIRASDWVIDLGPEGGQAGGVVIAEGTPVEVSKTGYSYTGQYL